MVAGHGVGHGHSRGATPPAEAAKHRSGRYLPAMSITGKCVATPKSNQEREEHLADQDAPRPSPTASRLRHCPRRNVHPAPP